MKSNFIYRAKTLPVLLILLFLSVCQIVSAQETKLKASAPSVVIQGQGFNYVVTSEEQGQISLNTPDGLRIMGAPSQMVSYQSSNVNGRLTNVTNISYTYVIIPENTGEYTIPAATLKVGRKELISNEVKIKVVEAAQAGLDESNPSGIIFQLIPSRRSIYEGEQIVLSSKVMVRERMQITKFPEMSHEGFWVEKLEGDNFAKNEVLEGYQYRSQVIARELLTAQRKGELKLGPYNMDVNIQKVVRNRRRSVFDDPFFDSPFQQYENTPASIRSNSVSVRVKPLPAGAPESFKGAVGNFTVKAEMTKDSIEVNESLAIKVRISGTGNLNLIVPPEIDFPKDLELLEPRKSSKLNHDLNGTSGNVLYEFDVIPRHGGNYRISPIEFSFFNPSTGRYDKYISPDFNFYVEGGEVIESQGTGLQGGFFREDVRNLDTDILYIKTSKPVLYEKGNFLVYQKLFYILVFALVLILLMSYFYWRNKITREQDIFYIRNKKAWKLASKRLKSARTLLQKKDEGLYDEILKAVNGYLSDRLSMNTADMSREKIEFALSEKSVSEELMEKLWNLVDDCEMARYSPVGIEDKQRLYDRAKECLSELEENI